MAVDKLTLPPLGQLRGQIRLPGSKSLSNRVLLLAALAEGTTEISNLLESDDVDWMVKALRQLGVRVQRSGLECQVAGYGGPLGTGSQALFLGNAGTAMRPLCAALCLGQGEFVLRGEPRMHERPIGPLVEALRSLGGNLEYLGQEGYPPLRLRASGLRGGATRVDASQSSQFVTALLLAAPLMERGLQLELTGAIVSQPYIDMTVALMGRFGAKVRPGYQVERGSYRSPGRVLVEGDASSASYFLAAAAVAGGPIRVLGVGLDSLQGDVAFADLLERMGARVQRGADFVEVERGQPLHGGDFDLTDLPDAAMTAATLALFAEGPTTIRGVANWRLKETDRLAAVSAELAKLGADVEVFEDGLTIRPGPLRSAEIATYNDHRMAMAFSLAALGSVPITILDPGCVSKTFPDYFEKLASLRAG